MYIQKREFEGVQIAYLVMGAMGGIGISLAAYFFGGMIREELMRRRARKAEERRRDEVLHNERRRVNTPAAES